METRRINLLLIVTGLGIAGAEKHVVSLANKLNTNRFRISLAYLKDLESDEVTLLPQLDRGRVEGGVFCCNVSKKIDMQAIHQLSKHIREEAVDVVVCTNAYPLLYGWLARIVARRNPRMAVVFHSTDVGLIKDKLQMLLYRPFFWLSDLLVYVCLNQKKYWRARALWARGVSVIHNGIDVDQFTDHYSPNEKHVVRQCYGFSADDYVVGLCAILRPEKAHSDLLKAVAKMRAEGLDTKCLLIGDGPERSKIEAEIETLGLTHHVRITGLLEDVRPAIVSCDVMALVSHNVETFSISTLESMALGKPMVMTKIGGATEQIVHGKNGYLYERGDITALANALGQLMDSKERIRMGEDARSTVAQNFSVKSMIDSYDQIFSQLAKLHV